jgi:ubiquinone/menaquinone biosynthesis C-methylase UbiE
VILKMEKGKYTDIADHYDWMNAKNPEKEMFFKEIFKKNGVSNVLDCACGTGNDILLFNSLGCNAIGSDLSESMLKIAKNRVTNANLTIPLIKADYRNLEENFTQKFDAVVCLSNSINELHEDNEVVKALKSDVALKKWTHSYAHFTLSKASN